MDHIYRVPTSHELVSLKNAWNTFCPQTGELSEEMYNRLIEKYSEPHRAYHNVGHLVELFEFFERYKSQFEDPQSVALALFFHDVIYDIDAPDNEEQSALYARTELQKLGVKGATITKVMDLINMTKTHSVTGGDHDAMLMLDMDMAVLGAEMPQYARYAKAIEAEFTSYYSPEDYRQGRQKFLNTYILKDRVFITDEFHETFGHNVRTNLVYEKQVLQSTPNTHRPNIK